MKIKGNKTYILLSATILLIALRDCAGVPVSFTVFSISACIAGLMLDREGRFLYAFSLIPFSRGLPFSEMILIVLLAEIADAALVKKDCRLTVKMYLPILGIFAIEVLDYIRFNVNSNEIVYLACYMLMATYAIDFQVFRHREKEFIYGYAAGTLIAVLLVVVREINALGLSYIFTYNVRFGANTGGRIVTNFNANELGLYCVAALCLLLALSRERREKLPFVMAVVVTAAGLVSVSRTYILLAVISWGLYLVLSKTPAKSILTVVFAFGAAFILAQKIIPDFTNWLQRYFVSRSRTAGGRLNLIADYFNRSFASVWAALFGYSESYASIFHSAASHNGVQEMFVCWGITGGFLGLLWIYMLLCRARGERSKEAFRWVPFFVFFIFIQSIQLFTMHVYLLVMALSTVPLFHQEEFDLEQAVERMD